MAPKTAAPRAEKGYVNPAGGTLNGWGTPVDEFEVNPELTWPNSVWTYNRMAREDARISSVLRAIGLPIRRTSWKIRQNGASDEATALVAQSLSLPIEGASDDDPSDRTRGRFVWRQHLREALKCLQYGHSVFETVYDIQGQRAVLKKLAPRPQSTISYFNVDRDGGLVSVQQWPPGTFAAPGMLMMGMNGMSQPIPVDRLAVYTHEMDPGVWTGNSLLRPAFKHWKLKDELMRIEAGAIRRYGIGVMTIWGNDADSEDEERMDVLLDIASNYSGGESAGLALTKDELAAILSPSGTPLDPRRAIEYHDHQMALVALAHFLNLEGKGGSYALASVQSDVFVQAVQTFAEDIRDTTQAGILMISHDLHVVMAETDTVICLNGHVCCRGTPNAVKTSPEYLRLFGDRAGSALAIYEHHHDHEHHEDGCVVGAEHGHEHAGHRHEHGEHGHVR